MGLEQQIIVAFAVNNMDDDNSLIPVMFYPVGTEEGYIDADVAAVLMNGFKAVLHGAEEGTTLFVAPHRIEGAGQKIFSTEQIEQANFVIVTPL